jgi:hypothetical protein
MAMQAPWDADAIRTALDEVFGAERYRWEIPPSPWAWVVEQWLRLTAWLAGLAVEHPGAYYALVVGLIVLLVAILVHLTYLTVLAFRKPADDIEARAITAHEARNAVWYLREAERLEEEGRLSESLAYRFAALVYVLDRNKVIRAHPSKTPAEYLHEAQLGPTGKDAFTGTIQWLYEHLFGGRPLDPSALAEFDRRAEDVVAHGPA